MTIFCHFPLATVWVCCIFGNISFIILLCRAHILRSLRRSWSGGASWRAQAAMALVPILNLPPIDALPPSSLASEADLLLLLHGSSPQSCQVRKGKSICSQEGGCESQGGEKCVMSKMKQSWLEKGLPLKQGSLLFPKTEFFYKG